MRREAQPGGISVLLTPPLISSHYLKELLAKNRGRRMRWGRGEGQGRGVSVVLRGFGG